MIGRLKFDGRIHNLTVLSTNSGHVVCARRSSLPGLREGTQ